MILTYLETWPSSLFALAIYNSLSPVSLTCPTEIPLSQFSPFVLSPFFSLPLTFPATVFVLHHQLLFQCCPITYPSALDPNSLHSHSFSQSLSSSSNVFCTGAHASLISVFLQYASAGCLLSLHHSEKPEHEEVCEFRPYTCPCPGASCKWQGSLEAVMPHLMHAHKSITTLQGEDIVFLATDINLPGAVDWVMMQSCFGHHFMLVLEKQEKYEGHQQFFAIVLLIGTRKQAENFAYRLELNGNRRRLTWEATPRSIHDGVAAAIMNSDCLVFDTSIAHLFADNGNLGINVTISMCWGGSLRLYPGTQILDNLCSLSDCRFWRQWLGDVYIWVYFGSRVIR